MVYIVLYDDQPGTYRTLEVVHYYNSIAATDQITVGPLSHDNVNGERGGVGGRGEGVGWWGVWLNQVSWFLFN